MGFVAFWNGFADAHSDLNEGGLDVVFENWCGEGWRSWSGIFVVSAAKVGGYGRLELSLVAVRHGLWT